MNKNFVKAIAMTAAIIMAQSTAVGVSAATAQTATVSSISATSSADSGVPKYNNNKGYTALDKWGHAYPYSYYYYADLATQKGTEDALDAYVNVYNALHEIGAAETTKSNKVYIKVPVLKNKSNADKKYNLAQIALCISRDCPDLYYINNSTNPSIESTKNGISTIKIITTMTKAEVAEYDKKCAAAVKSFKSKISKKSNLTTKGFYEAALDFVSNGYGIEYSEGNDIVQTAAGFFANKKANCMGYTEAFNYLCQMSGMPYASVRGKIHKSSAHNWAKVPINNVWYVVDVTNGDYYPDRSFISDAEYAKKVDATEDSRELRLKDYLFPAANGKAIVPNIPNGGKTSTSTTSTTATTSANAKKAVSVTIKSDSLKSYKDFKTALKSAVKKAEDGGYGYLTLKSSKTKTLEKYLKQAKEDGIISYSSLKAVEGGIRIKF